MLRTRSLLVLPLLALVLCLIATALPAEAAAKKPKVTVSATSGVVALPGSAAFTGKVSGPSSGAKVRLQQRVGGSWKTVKSTKVKRNKTFRFRSAVKDTRTSFRVKVVKNKKVRSATSKTVRVTGTICSLVGTTSDDPVRNIILQRTNKFRTDNGLCPLALMPELNTVAQAWTLQMASSNNFRHNPNYTASYPAGWSAAGENIGRGQTPDGVVTAWINSAGHRANLLGDFTSIGIGYATSGQDGVYYTQNFAKYPGR